MKIVDGKTELRGNLYKNTIITLVAQVIRLLLQFILQRVFIETLGEEYLGYNSVFKNILQMLNMADLGVGVAITGFLYSPLSDGDDKRVSALMYIFKRVYHIIGMAVIALSSIMVIVLPMLIPDAKCTYGYLRVLFAVNVIGTVSSYFLSYKRTLLIANQKSYYTSYVDLISDLVGTVLQIVFLYLMPIYMIYLVINVLKNVFSNILISIKCNKSYFNLVGDVDKRLVDEYKKPLSDYVKDVFVSKIGGYVYSGTDNIIISIFKGSVLAGYLSNYTLVSIGLKAIITQILSSIQATYGRYIVTEKDRKKQLEITDSYLYVDFMIGNVCMITCILVYQKFIPLFVGNKYLLSRTTAALVSINLGLAILLIIPTQVFTIYRLFRYDKLIIIISAILNIVISSVLVVKIGVEGVLIGTTITSMIYLFSRLYIMAKHVFEIGYTYYLTKILVYLVISIISFSLTYLLTYSFIVNSWLRLVMLALTVIAISTEFSLVLSMWMKENSIVINKVFSIRRKHIYILLVSLAVIGLSGIFLFNTLWKV